MCWLCQAPLGARHFRFHLPQSRQVGSEDRCTKGGGKSTEEVTRRDFMALFEENRRKPRVPR